jgi:hypothetical protein
VVSVHNLASVPTNNLRIGFIGSALLSEKM